MRRFPLFSSLLSVLLGATPCLAQTHPQASGTAPAFAGFTAAQTIPNAISFGMDPTLVGGLSTAFVDDFNHDGHPDLLTIDSYGSISLALNDGKGNFGAPILSAMPGGATLWTYAVTADLNGDGYLDIVSFFSGFQNVPPQIVTEINQKNGTFAVGSSLNVGHFVFPPAQGFTFGNTLMGAGVTRPGHLADLVFESVGGSNLSPSLTRVVFLSDGSGQFSDAAASVVQVNVPTSYSFSTQRLWLTDLNHDGEPDLLVGSFNRSNGTTTVDLAIGHGDGTFATPETNPVATLPQADIATLSLAHIRGSVNAPDIVIATRSMSYIATANGDGTYQSPVLLLPDEILNMQLLDLDGDGISDLLYAASGSVAAYKGNADGTFGPALSGYVTGESASLLEQGTAFADIDGDGVLDFVNAVPYYGDVTFGRGLGKGLFAATPLLSHPIGTGSLLGVALSNGDGTFQTPITVPFPISHDFALFSFAAGDVNGDGKQDQRPM